MKLNRFDLNKCGIYCIRNKVNNKVYIGKSKNIYLRIVEHNYLLNTSNKNENRHLINAWHKYGQDNFEYIVLEYLEFDEQKIAERELYWMQAYDSTNREKGYNLRMDSSTKMIIHEETKKILSEINSGEGNPNYDNKWSNEMKENLSKKLKDQFKNGRKRMTAEEAKEKTALRNKKWKENPELKEQMKQKVREKITKYQIYQYDKKTQELVKIWDCVNDIIVENPSYKKHNIYAVCSGEKPTMYGYIWLKVLKEDIVQTDSKESE